MPFPAALTAVGEVPGMFSGEKGKAHTTVTGTCCVCRKSQCQCDMKKGGLHPFISNSYAAFTLFGMLRQKPTYLCRVVCCVLGVRLPRDVFGNRSVTWTGKKLSRTQLQVNLWNPSGNGNACFRSVGFSSHVQTGATIMRAAKNSKGLSSVSTRLHKQLEILGYAHQAGGQ